MNISELGLFDFAQIQTQLGNKDKLDNSVKLESSQLFIQKIASFCDSEISKFKSETQKWSTKQHVFQYGQNLQRISESITDGIALTSDFENKDEQSERWKQVVSKFLELCVSFLENCKKHPDLLAESEIEEYRDIVADDFLQDLDRSNSQLFNLIWQDKQTSAQMREMMQAYR